MIIHSHLTAAALLLGTAAAAVGQQPEFVVTGRVAESGTNTPIAGATVELAGAITVLTNNDGLFRFIDVPAGRFALRVQALGYRTEEMTLVVERDTVVMIALEVVPVTLDPLDVAARTVTVRGTVKDAETGTGLIDVDIAIEPSHAETTDPIGRFKLERVPAGPPLVLTVRGFGYLPETVEFTAENDTSLNFELEIDSLAQRMIAAQVELLKERSGPHLASVMPAMTRSDLMSRINWTMLDIIKTQYPTRFDNIGCVMIDDVQTNRGIGELQLLLPDRYERIEFLFRGQMLRIYSRDFIRRMMAGAVVLADPLLVPPVGDSEPPLCR